nr:hypothetical protein [Tanacetum cinerariifolium]
MHSARSQSTANGSKPMPRRNTQTSRNWSASKNSFVMIKTVPIAEHSRNFSDSKHFVCSTCQKCVFNANHDSCVTKFLKEVNSRAKVPSTKTTNIIKPIEQISVPNKQERQIPTGHSTTKVDNEPRNGSNADITNQYECEHTLDVSVVQTPGSRISILLAVGTPSTASGNLYCQWELSPGSGNALCILFPTINKRAVER